MNLYQKLTYYIKNSFLGSVVLAIAMFFGLTDTDQSVTDIYQDGSIIKAAHASNNNGGGGGGGGDGCGGSGCGCGGCGSGAGGGCGSQG